MVIWIYFWIFSVLFIYRFNLFMYLKKLYISLLVSRGGGKVLGKLKETF